MSNNKEEHHGPELFFGVVGAAGTDLDIVCDKLKETLSTVNYKTEIIPISSLLNSYGKRLNIKLISKPENMRIIQYMDLGDRLRKTVKDGSALAILSFGYIRNFRRNTWEKEKRKDLKKYAKTRPIQRQAYIFKSLKHEEEVIKLRQTYGKNFWLISVYSPREIRVQYLAEKIAGTKNEIDPMKCRPDADNIIQRDEFDSNNAFGQNVRGTFPLGDVFIKGDDKIELEESIERFIQLVFGNTFHTPTNEEFGMFYAFASALRSSSLARQVGASITTKTGDIIATGTNEVPKAGGGLYGEDSMNDEREWKRGFDSNDKKKKQMLRDILQKLNKIKWLSKEKMRMDLDKLTEMAWKGELNDIQLMNLTEFGREVHAEMASLMDAARKTIGVKDGSMYCTTFPCHVCAKHIVASGLAEVVYIEPYPKSLAKQLFSDSISMDEGVPNKVNFRPFVGIHPHRYMDLFTMTERKKNGKIKLWNGSKADPRFKEIPLYLLKEEREMNKIYKNLNKNISKKTEKSTSNGSIKKDQKKKKG